MDYTDASKDDIEKLFVQYKFVAPLEKGKEGAFQDAVGTYFQVLVHALLRIPENKAAFVLGDRTKVLPDGVQDASLTELDAKTFLPKSTCNVRDGHFVEIKATRAKIGIGDKQIKGYIEALSKHQKAAKCNAPAVLTLVTTSDSGATQELIRSATANNIIIFHARIQIDDRNGEKYIRVSSATPLNQDDVYKRLAIAQNQNQGVLFDSNPFPKSSRGAHE